MGILLDEVGQHAQARIWFARVAGLQPSPFPFWRFLTATSLGKEKLYPEALAELELARDEGAAGPAFDFQYARALAAMGEYDRALVLLEKVRACRGDYYHLVDCLREIHHIAWNPAKTTYFAILSAIYIYRKSKAHSLRHLRDALISFIVPLVMILSTAMEAVARQLPILKNSKLATIMDPGNPYVSLGTSLISSGKYLAAQKQFKKAAARSNRFNTWMNLCSASVMVRDWEEARVAYDFLSRHWPEEIPAHYEKIINRGLAGERVAFAFRTTIDEGILT